MAIGIGVEKLTKMQLSLLSFIRDMFNVVSPFVCHRIRFEPPVFSAAAALKKDKVHSSAVDLAASQQIYHRFQKLVVKSAMKIFNLIGMLWIWITSATFLSSLCSP